ncbi:MAG: type II toxin-antitoxin system RelE/ParE family toxin [Candidatus Pacebacteria bacterium]|nr:type II toxin-antitoxin system RelE/ParE family toxin [Candidatus Paceibacterota bacterium]
MHKILLSKRVEKELKDLPTTTAKRMVVALDELNSLGSKSSNVKKLQTPFPGYRKRVGDYRILFEINDEIIIIYRITKRSEAYR